MKGNRILWGAILGSLLILAVLADVLIPAYRSAKIAAKTQEELHYVRNADGALLNYLGDHGYRYPRLSGDMVATLRPYIKDPQVIQAMGHFVWSDKLSGKKIGDLKDPANQIVVYSVVPGASSVAVGMADGFAKRWPLGYLPTIVATAKSGEHLPYH